MKNLIIKKASLIAATLLLTGSIGMNVCAASAPENKSAGKTTEMQEERPSDDKKMQNDEAEKPTDEAEKPTDEIEEPTDEMEKPLDEADRPTDEDEENKDMELTNMLDIAEAQNAIDAIEDDDDLQSSLQDLLDTYTAALDAEKDGIDDDSLSDDEIETLHQAVTDAANAFLDAMEDAGISTDNIRKQENLQKTDEPTEEAAVPEETIDSSDSSNTSNKVANVFKKAKTWLKNLFS